MCRPHGRAIVRFWVTCCEEFRASCLWFGTVHLLPQQSREVVLLQGGFTSSVNSRGCLTARFTVVDLPDGTRHARSNPGRLRH